MSADNEFINFGFKPNLDKYLSNNGGFIRYAHVAKIGITAKPAPTLHNRRAGVWYGVVCSAKLELPVLSVVTFNNRVGITLEGAQWYVGAPSLERVFQTLEEVQDSIAPQEAAMLTLSEHGPFTSAYRAMAILHLLLPAADFGLSPRRQKNHLTA